MHRASTGNVQIKHNDVLNFVRTSTLEVAYWQPVAAAIV